MNETAETLATAALAFFILVTLTVLVFHDTLRCVRACVCACVRCLLCFATVVAGCRDATFVADNVLDYGAEAFARHVLRFVVGEIAAAAAAGT